MAGNGHAPARVEGDEDGAVVVAAAADAARGVGSAPALEDRALAHGVDAQNPGDAAAALGQYGGPASVALTSAAVRDVVEDRTGKVKLGCAAAAADADADDVSIGGADAAAAAAAAAGVEAVTGCWLAADGREDAAMRLRVLRVGRKMVLTKKTGVDAWSREAAP